METYKVSERLRLHSPMHYRKFPPEAEDPFSNASWEISIIKLKNYNHCLLQFICNQFSTTVTIVNNLFTIVLTFNDPKKEGFGKHCRKRRKCWFPAFSPFPTMFSTLITERYHHFRNILFYICKCFQFRPV